ncbi:hypothetical protein [Photobacterium gaetbulicola]|nr:hypothetical protein [Photobacterium gaetbulicola]
MNKKLILSIGTLLLSGGAWASQTDSGSFQIDMDGDVDTIQVRADSNPNLRRTNFFTGLNYNEAVFERAPKRSNVRLVYLDGSTRINEHWRIRHVLSEAWLTEGKNQERTDGRVNFTIAPRYEHWVSPKVSWFAEPVYIRGVEASNGLATQELKLKPGVQLTFGQHFISTTGDYQFKWRERYNREDNDNWQAYSADVNYVYRYSPQFNFGISGTYSGTVDNSDYEFRRKNYNVKPFVRLRHYYDITTEVNTTFGREESGQHWVGYDYASISINNNKRITRNLRFVANAQYKEGKRNGPPVGVTDWSGGDKEELQFRVGFNITL